jgi:hypothetical protein
MGPIPGSMIAVWFSCGAANAVAAKLTLERFGATHDVRIVNNPIADESQDNQRFLRDVQEWIGRPIESAINANYPNCSIVEIFEKRKYMSGPLGAPCTMLLKKEARQQWEQRNRPDWTVMGFTTDEKRRHDSFVLTERETTIPVLIDAGLSKNDCFKIVTGAGIELPDAYRRGYPNANCPGCVKATSPTYWNHVRKVDPEVFAHRAEQSRRFGVRLAKHKGERVFLDELPIDAKGRSMKTMTIECGIFCEEPITQGAQP